MIVTRLNGGLGNQMFQYAYGLKLAKSSSQPFMIDVDAFRDHSLRSVGLHHFCITCPTIPADQRGQIPGRYRNQSRLRETLSTVGARFLRTANSPLRLVREKPFGYRSEYPTRGENLYLDGYWQSERFFAGIEGELRNEFQLRTSLSDESARVADQMRSRNSVAIHVRRGDYVNNLEAAKIYRHLTAEYYRRCLVDLRERFENLTVFLFSDDVDWCLRKLDVGLDFRPISHNDSVSAHEDLFLIGQCSHAIIANSSFSWWGAYLGTPHRDRRIYYPDPWFHSGTLDGTNIGCCTWISETDIRPIDLRRSA